MKSRKDRLLEWRRKHKWYLEVYLSSPAWEHRRSQVLSRCHGTCEGCLKAPATHVHHLSYEHIGTELLWELVGVCGACHLVAHKKVDKPHPWE